MIRFLASLSFALILSACGSQYPSAQPTLSPEQSVYQLRENDTITLRVFDETELSGKYVIDSQGQVALPLVGKIGVRQMTEQQAADTIRHALQKGGFLQHPKVSVEVAKARPFFVMGEVERSGNFTFQPGMTAYQAIAMAGGYNIPRSLNRCAACVSACRN